MGEHIRLFWQSSMEDQAPRRERRSGDYRAYLPAPLVESSLRVEPELDVALGRTERAISALAHGPGHEELAGVARFLLRSEAIASSRIEGIAPAPRQVALAELASDEPISGVTEQAESVARNMTLVREATTTMGWVETVSLDHILDLHRALLSNEPRHHGLRKVQNWIGGSDYHPLDAEFVPPPPAHVPALMADLTGYLNGAAHSALVQAALVHAQFETIHPFTDGNGRVGRALIHTVLTRRGLTPAAILPISLILATLRERYVAGLTAFRYVGTQESPAADAGRRVWLSEFADCARLAAEEATRLRDAVLHLREEWAEELAETRREAGRTRALREDSATAAVLAGLPSTPVLTAATVERMHGVSKVAAAKALAELRGAGVLREAAAGRGVRAFYAPRLLDLITLTERRLASTHFDTRISPPARPVPARPDARTS